MKKIILPLLAMLIVAGCSDSDGAANSAGATTPAADDNTSKTEVPIDVDVSKPPKEVPDGADDLQACVAIDAVRLMDLAGTIIEWTTKSMADPYAINSKQCIPADSEIPVDNDGYPKFIVIDLYDITGIDLVKLISEQLVPVGQYTSMALSVLQGSYGDFLNTPYSYVGNPVDKMKMDIVEDLKFDGLNINIDVPKTFTMSFDLRSMIQMIENAYKLKNEGFRIVDNALAATIHGDVDDTSCANSVLGAYVYLYPAGMDQHGDLGSDYAPVQTAKVNDDNSYSMKYVPEGDYDIVLVCDALLDVPNQIDLDIDLDGSSKYEDQHIVAGDDHYRNL
ncbi:membrane lipoprotein lipid attachment site-containing protein [Photobacterium ganghwense]|uniref:membrane lipoprotein lipid attachment site-containing protein n=1 Tax=Photobacterium ganghwense TaxID=320778 RepID=UPI001C2CF84A|nr:membrane lipoprotein lipid attachment site-containing protein [Photobacterium ganghwense]MBV1840700.1 lipoprotein [Photobacterium ganghwense]